MCWLQWNFYFESEFVHFVSHVFKFLITSWSLGRCHWGLSKMFFLVKKTDLWRLGDLYHHHYYNKDVVKTWKVFMLWFKSRCFADPSIHTTLKEIIWLRLQAEAVNCSKYKDKSKLSPYSNLATRWPVCWLSLWRWRPKILGLLVLPVNIWAKTFCYMHWTLFMTV